MVESNYSGIAKTEDVKAEIEKQIDEAIAKERPKIIAFSVLATLLLWGGLRALGAPVDGVWAWLLFACGYVGCRVWLYMYPRRVRKLTHQFLMNPDPLKLTSEEEQKETRSVLWRVSPVWAALGPFKNGKVSALAFGAAFKAVMGWDWAKDELEGHANNYDADPIAWEKIRQEWFSKGANESHIATAIALMERMKN